MSQVMPEQPYLNSYMVDEDKPIDYKRYIFLVRKNIYYVLIFFIIAITLASIYTSKIPDRFTAVTQIIIERPGSNQNSEQFVGDSAAQSEDYYRTQMEIIKSPKILRQVIADLNLTQYFGIDNEERVGVLIQRMISVQRIRGSRLINIDVKTTDPRLSANLANQITRVYIRESFESSLYYSKEILNWLPQDDGASDKVTVQTPYGGVKQVSREELIDTLPSVQSDPTIRELKHKRNALQSELDLKLRKYRHKHPVIIKLKSNLKFVEESIADEKKIIVEDLKSKAEGRHKLVNARIVEEAPIPKAPDPSNRLILFLVLTLGELFGSIFLIILLDFFNDTIMSIEDMERKGILLPFLGPVGLIKGKYVSDAQKSLSSFHEKHVGIAESFRYLRVAINFSASPEKLKNLLITSSLPGEGKSFISHNLAISLALDGNRTLLVDADLRRPVVHRIFRLENSVGLANYLTSNIEFKDVCRESFVENLTIITSGPSSPNPGEILGSPRMRQFISDAHKHYDRIIFDCPPLTGIGDGFVLGSLIGHVILTVAAGRTPSELIKRLQSQLDKAGIKILGLILNKVNLEKERYGGYYKYYYHTYHKYYGQKQEEAS